jgi:hypothetical protein
VRIRFNANYQAKARRASEKAAAAVFATMNGRFQAAIKAKVWTGFPNVTIRSNGQRAGDPRNIVDRGLLGQSNKLEISGVTARFSWGGTNVTYATAVHEGAKLANGTLIQARPWTGAVLGTDPTDGIPVYDYRKAFRDVWLQAYRREI